MDKYKYLDSIFEDTNLMLDIACDMLIEHVCPYTIDNNWECHDDCSNDYTSATICSNCIRLYLKYLADQYKKNQGDCIGICGDKYEEP